jgi:hypothetical protein
MKIALFVVFFLLAVIADNLPFLTAVKGILQSGTSSFETIRSKDMEDIKKEKILLANSLSMFIQSFKIIAFILLVAVCGALFIYIISAFYRSVSFGFLIDYTISVNGLIISVAAFFSYFLIKKLYVKIRL